MNSKFLRICSMILTIVMVFNMLPMQALGEMVFTEKQTISATDETLSADSTATKSATSAEIVEEIEENRTEYTKEFKLSNGLHMAVVYGDPVHYENNGKWDEIDNTLKATTKGTYTNTAGVWDVCLPQQLNRNNPVTITKDGYTLSFVLAGELNKPSDTVVMSEQSELIAQDVTAESNELTSQSNISVESGDAVEPYSIASAQSTLAQVVDLDYESYKAEAEYEETVIEKRQSRLLYSNVYSVTDITYDLSSNQVKESIIMHTYKEALRGYKYTLNVGTMIPVLGEDGHIDFYNEDETKIIMVMPAPFLMDAGYSYNEDIDVQLVGKDGTYTLTYILPQNWLKDESRQWPVILDPVVQPALTTSNIRDRLITQNTVYPYNGQVLEAGRGGNDGVERFYVKYRDLPSIGPSDVVVEAQIKLKVCGGYNAPKVEVHKVPGTWESETISWTNNPGYNPIVEDYSTLASNTQWHQWTITDIVRGWYEGENTGMMFKASDEVEKGTATKWRQYVSSDGGGSSDRPTLTIKFRNNNGLQDYWSYTSASAGRAGTGYVNDYTGNLVWIRGDIGFSGNRMPVAISHAYNANDTIVTNSTNNSMTTSGNAFGMGYGWRTTYNQVVYRWSLDSKYYVWEDGDGTDHYFEYTGSSGKYADEDGLEMLLTVTGNGYTITDKSGGTLYFDSQGRFYKQENNQATKSAVNIYYTTDTGKLIDYITDAVGRKYDFIYDDNNMLTRISYLGSEAYQTAHANQADREISYVTYAYDTNNNLTTITDADGKISSFEYHENSHLLKSAQDVDGYKLSYTYTQHNPGKPSRIKTVQESHNGVDGSSLTISYGHNQTTFTDHNGNVQICQFNDWGNTISVQDGLGRAQHADFTFNSSADVSAAVAAGNTSAKSNQLALSSKLQNTVKNYFVDQSFENGDAWEGGTISMAYSYMGARSMHTTGNAAINMFDVAPDESVTFSAYVKTTEDTAFINIGDDWGDYPGPVIDANTDWTRVEVNYTNNTGGTQQVYAEFTAYGDNGAYIDCVQFEKMPTASRYNLIDNGDFSNGLNSWTGSNYALATGISGAPQLDNKMVTVTGDPSTTRQLSQTVNVSGAEGDCFVLAGWAKGDSVPLSNKRTFGIIGTFNYTDGTKGDFTASFNPDTNDTVAWQYTAEPMVAKKAYSSITVNLAFDYNANTVCFDGVQLFKETFGESYTYDKNGNIIAVVDLQQQETKHTYANNNLTETILPSGAKMSYTHDAYHNVKTATSAEGQVYSFEYDTYGNNISVSITNQNGTVITSSAAYSENGNYVVSNTDALGKITTYEYDPETNMVLSVKYPNDTDDTKTEYTYDAMYNLASAVATAESSINDDLYLSASYSYTNDLLTSVQKPNTLYTFLYGNFGLMTDMKVGSDRTLASYEYTTDGNNYLEAIDFHNGGKVEYDYDSYGRVLTETYDEEDTVTYHYDNDGALAAVSDSQSGITTRYYYDFSGRSVGYNEVGPGFSHTVGYEYDSTNNLEQLVETIDGVKRTTSYKYDKDNRVTSITTDGVTVEYTYDPLGRTTQQVTKKGSSTILTEYFTYKEENYKTSNQVWKYRVQSENADFLYEYTYDDNGNITQIVETDNETGSIFTTKYTYDTANQLVREDNQRREESYTWTYDNAGNITHYKTYTYTTGDLGTPTTVEYKYEDEKGWGDLLTTWGGKDIVYDAVGNPTLIGDKDNPAASVNQTFVWEHGNRLASMTKDGVTWDYSYNNAGLRTSRSNDDITYKYVYDGDKLSQMTIIDKENDGEQTNKQVVNFTYNAAGAPLTMTYGGQTYYYTTNMQGDVTGLLNNLGHSIITYSYSAYGLYTYEAGDNAALAETLSKINPLGYRGYLLDVETGMYYLQSRYYDPAMGRFLNPDSVMADADGDLLGYNLYAYCKNNPIRYSDSDGNWPKWAKKMVAAVAVVAVVAAVAAITVATAGAGTAVACAAMGAAQGAAVGALTGAVSGAVEGAVTHRIKTGSWAGAGEAALEGAADGALTGAITGAVTGAINSPYCFVAGTLIWTELGTAPIETIVAGDMVWAWDEKTGDVALKEVVETYINETDELVHIYVDGEKITTTPSHPFYSPVKGWTDATRLRAGDILVLVNGEYVVVEKVQHELLENPIAVYNFQVEDYHTYYVSEDGILVHNSCAPKQSNSRSSAVRKAWKNEVNKVKQTGRGSREWSPVELDELLTTGKVKGYQGHHIKSVKGHPDLAGDPNNIQFLTRQEHLAAHGGNWRNITNTRYKP